MTDRVLLSAGADNIRVCVDLAVQCDLGIEVTAFASPRLLDGAWQQAIEHYRDLLAPVPGPLALHGPFMDLAPGSPDRRVRQVAAERYQHALHIAQALGVKTVIFHANFIAAIHTESYRRSWIERNISFWSQLADDARQHDVLIAVENMWEFDPDIIGAVLRAVNHPNLRACLDVGHAHLYSQVPLADWLATLAPYLIHVHLNNNDGISDMHRALDAGVIDYAAVMPQLRAMPNSLSLTLEMDSPDDMRRSLDYLQLAQTAPCPRRQVSLD